MGSFAKECSHLYGMSAKDALRIKKEFDLKKQVKDSIEDYQLERAKAKSKKAAEEIRKMLDR